MAPPRITSLILDDTALRGRQQGRHYRGACGVCPGQRGIKKYASAASTSGTTVMISMLISLRCSSLYDERGGVRIEDLIAITDKGAKVLTHSLKDLTIFEPDKE